MGVIWEKAPNDVHQMAHRILQRYHPELAEAHITLGILFATSASEDDPHPLKVNKYPAAAIIKITSTRDRAAGKPDAEIAIDRGQWDDDLSAKTREALIDHELTHLVVVKDAKTKKVKTDCVRRPRLRARLHDWQIGGFRAIAERWGADAIEVQAAREVAQQHGQLLFDFAEA